MSLSSNLPYSKAEIVLFDLNVNVLCAVNKLLYIILKDREMVFFGFKIWKIQVRYLD